MKTSKIDAKKELFDCMRNETCVKYWAVKLLIVCSIKKGTMGGCGNEFRKQNIPEQRRLPG